MIHLLYQIIIQRLITRVIIDKKVYLFVYIKLLDIQKM